MNYYEISDEKELEHLRNLMEILMLNALNDKQYLKNNAIRSLIREVLLKKGNFYLIFTVDYYNSPTGKLLNFKKS